MKSLITKTFMLHDMFDNTKYESKIKHLYNKNSFDRVQEVHEYVLKSPVNSKQVISFAYDLLK